MSNRHLILSRAALEARRVAADAKQTPEVRHRCLALFKRIKSHVTAI
jgi:hypothetical protein